MKVLVCGGRDYTNRKNVFAVLDKFHEKDLIDQVIHGGAMGADYLAHEWASARHVVVRTFMAEWALHGNRAGPIRNRQMLVLGKPDYVVAFPGGRGTANMVTQTMRAAVPVYQISDDGIVSVRE